MMEITDRILTSLVRQGIISSLDGWQIQPASGGLNSRVYFVQHQAEDRPSYTVRASLPGKEWILERESGVLCEAARHCDCAPALAGVIEPESGGDGTLLVHDFAPGVTIQLDVVSDARLQYLAVCLAGLHQLVKDSYEIWPGLEPASGSRADAFRERLTAVERYKSFGGSPGSGMHERIRHVYRQLQEVSLVKDGWDETVFARLHGDLSAGNILWDNDQVMLIDWEYARNGDPAEDLAYLFAEQPVSTERAAVFHASYVNAGGDASAVARAATYTVLVALDSALWWGDYVLKRGSHPESSQEAALHLARAEAALQAINL